MFSAYKTIKVLTYFFEYLDDNTIKKFIGFVFGKDKFIIDPFDTYKEFFLYLLNINEFNAVYGSNITYADLVSCKKEIIGLQEDGLLDIEKEICLTNNYYTLKCLYEGTNDINDLYLGCDDIEELLEFYNNLFIPIANSCETILSCITCITESIYEYLDTRHLQKNKTSFIKFLQYALDKIIKDKYCYVIYEPRKSIEFEVIKKVFTHNWDNKLEIISENYIVEKQEDTFIMTECSSGKQEIIKNFDELYKNADMDINNFRKLNTVINNAIKSINEKTQPKKYCHICFSLISNGQTGKCKNCEKIYDLIKEIDDTQKTNNINSRIKYLYKDDKKLDDKGKKKKYYENLIKYVKDLEEWQNVKNNKTLQNVNKKCIQKKFDELYSLINKGFGES